MANLATMSVEELRAYAARLEAAQRNASKLTLKVSEKGGVMILGLQKFPVTLYQEQWQRVLGAKEEILSFIEDHKESLKVKGE
jgi:hypothetical protein